MKDVAVAAGVAQSTVSRILSGSPVSINVTAATRARVHAMASELGYRPHPIARALRGAPTMLLGAVVRDMTDVFFNSAIEALSIAARAHGYSVVLGHARQEADEALALAAVLESRQCDAIVLLGDLRDEPRMVADLRDARIPVVALWHGSRQDDDAFATVSVDNRAGLRAALAHLSSLGHRRIAFVGDESLKDIRERQAAYEEYVAEGKALSPPGYIQHVPNLTSGGEAGLVALMSLAEPPSAIIAATDILALGVLHAAYERGLTVPRDVSVVGFDDIPIAAVTIPGLTTVRMPVAEMVAASVELAIGSGISRHTASGPTNVIFQPELVVRRSTARVPSETAGDRP